MVKKAGYVTLCLGVLAAVTLSATNALAGSLHFVGSPKAAVVGDAVVVSGKVAGLGNGDITVTVEVDGEVTVLCVSPGGNVAPGQNKEPFTAVDSRTFVPSAKNGQFTFTIAVDVADAIAEAVAQHECANRNWTKEVDDISFDSATVTVEQGGQTISRTLGL
jgi:hypothetical protein